MLITFEYSKFYCLKLHPITPFFLLAKNMIKTRHTVIHKPMSISCSLICFSFLLSILIKLAHSATFEIENQCSHPVWAAAVPGGGKQLNSSQSWIINVKPGTTQARIWGRTNCTFNATGYGHCETGDCNGLLRCQSYGQPPNTLAEYALNLDGDIDYLDISLVDGFNIPMNLTPITGRCNGTTCSTDINGQCPTELQAPGGCNNPCAVFKTDQYCCDSGTCGATNFSRFFKERCPNAYSYLMDDLSSTFTCPSGTNYKVVFCPKMNGTKEDNSSSTDGATFEIRNQCPYTVWAAAKPGGGIELTTGQTWTIAAKQGTTQARIWARTGCNFDENGRGTCQTGDCGGVLQCTGFGKPPNTLAEFALNQPNNLDFMDISLVDGFNVPMEFSSVSGCTHNIQCTADIVGQCPNELKAPGGCNNPCTVFKTREYCCTQGPCGPTDLSRFFKTRCPDAYSYPQDDATSTFTCPSGTNYRVSFCP